MVENGYLDQARSVHDKRSVRVKLTPKGKDLHQAIDDMFRRHEDNLEGTPLTNEKLSDLSDTMRKLERFWNAQVSFGGM